MDRSWGSDDEYTDDDFDIGDSVKVEKLKDDNDASDSEIEIIKVEYGSKTCVKEERASTAMDNAYASISEESDGDSEDQETVPECRENIFKK